MNLWWCLRAKNDQLKVMVVCMANSKYTKVRYMFEQMWQDMGPDVIYMFEGYL